MRTFLRALALVPLPLLHALGVVVGWVAFAVSPTYRKRFLDNARLAAAPTTLAGVKQLLKALKSGEAVALLPDQVPPQGQGVWAPFFGRPAYTMTLPARLALQANAVLLLARSERLALGRGYVVHIR